MGQANTKLTRLLAKQPICIFCGGTTPAESRDRVPPKSMFDKAERSPEFVFPACRTCNNNASRHDIHLALLSRMSIDDDDHEVVQRLVRKLQRLQPGALNGADDLPAATRRRLLRNVPLPAGVPRASIGLVKVTPAQRAAMDTFAAKLTIALHYLHSGSIAPPDAIIQYAWETNHSALLSIRPSIPDEFVELLKSSGRQFKERTDLTGQFAYVYGFYRRWKGSRTRREISACFPACFVHLLRRRS
ncbi:hypothetical protein BH10PSE17_BH10PSE17_26770 [soil metagenome]